VTFSIDDINNQGVEEMEEDDEDQALEDEPLINQQSDPQSAKSIRTAPEDQIEESEPIDEDDSLLRDPFPAKISINITKDGKPGAMVFEAVTQYGSVNIEDFWHFEDGKLSKPADFAAEGKRTKVYAGPPFGTLDVELAQLLEQYLADRGINESMAEFVTEYIEYKEGREYTRWLANIKTFFE
jgi:complement component 1 Q subcomponent-binding protein